METIEITLTEIERRTRAFAAEQNDLRILVSALQAEVEDAKRRALKGIRRAVERTKTRQAELRLAIEQRPDLFAKPRTIVIDGIKVGFQKQKGKLSFDDPDVVCRLIYRHLPGMVDELIETTERPRKDALARLPATDLRRIGVTLSDDTDAVVIKDTAGDVDRLVDALLREEKEEGAE